MATLSELELKEPGRAEPGVHAPEISVLVVAFRSRDFILDCIGSIFEETRETSFEVLLIDNSDDGAGPLVAERFPAVRVIANRENLGFGPGNNRLAAVARGDKLLLLNPDTVVRDRAVDRLAAFSRTMPAAGAWGGITVTPAGAPDAGNHLVFPTLLRLLCWALGDGAALQGGGLARDAIDPGRVDILTGGFMMARRDVWESLGGFDESFFLYSEEIDLFLRMKRAGFEVWATPAAIVEHDVGSGERHSPQRILYRTKGQMHFVRKHWARPKAQAAFALLWVSFAWRWLAAMLLGAVSPQARATEWRAKRRAYGGVALRPWLWWRGYAR